MAEGDKERERGRKTAQKATAMGQHKIQKAQYKGVHACQPGPSRLILVF